MKKMNIKGLLLLSSVAMLITGCTEKSYNVVKTVDSNKTHYHSSTRYSYYYKGANNSCCDKIQNVSQKENKTSIKQKDTKNVNININIQPVKSSVTNKCETCTFDVDGDEIDHY